WQSTTDRELALQTALYEQHNGAAEGRVRIWYSLRTIFNNSDELITRTAQLAKQHQTGIMMHVAEIREENEFAIATRGTSTVTHLYNLGVLAPNLLAAHCVWMTEDEIAMFRDHDVKVTHNPAAAMKVLGFAKIPEMLDEGITVSIGTDGAPCNNRMSLVDEMWLTSLIHKGRTLDPTVMDAQSVLAMGTILGAKSLLWDDEIGSLEVGKKADLIVVNPDTANMLPLHDPVANLISAMKTDNIESTMVDGRWLMRDREILVVDEAEVIERAKRHAAEIAERGGINLPDRFPVL
ncbi:MAG: amidohydrolase family protein, partial [Chloroflexota bacterium]